MKNLVATSLTLTVWVSATAALAATDSMSEKTRNLAVKALIPICGEFGQGAIASGKIPKSPGGMSAGTVGELPNAKGEFSCKVIYTGPPGQTFELRMQDDCTGNPQSQCMSVKSIKQIPN